MTSVKKKKKPILKKATNIKRAVHALIKYISHFLIFVNKSSTSYSLYLYIKNVILCKGLSLNITHERQTA